jgi:hypothetical protein
MRILRHTVMGTATAMGTAAIVIEQAGTGQAARRRLNKKGNENA